MRLKDEEKREAIKQASFDLVAEQGVAGLKMATLAKRAGFSPSTLYVYFKDKEDLVITLFREVYKGMVDRVLEVHQPGRPFEEDLRHVWKRYLMAQIEHHKELFFLEQVKTSPYFMKNALDIKDAEMAAPFEVLRLGKEQGLLKDLPETLLFASMEGMTDKMSELFRKGVMELTPENLDACFLIVWDGLKR